MALRALQSTASGTGPVGGSGTIDTIPRWTAASTLGDSLLSQSGAIVTNSGTFRAANGTFTEPAYTFSGSSGMGMYRATSGALLRFAVSGAYAFGVDTNGNFGIGTATPSSPGTIQGAFSAAVPQLIVRDSAGASGAVWVTSNHSTLTGTIRVGPVSGGYGFAVYDSFSHTFRESGNHAMTILNGGNVGIGTASPVSRLDVAGTITCDDAGTGLKLPATPGNADTQTLDCYLDGGASGGATWAPVDNSGAGLTFTVTTARYIRVGRLVVASFDITFPATASGLQAKVSLPVTAQSAWGGASIGFGPNVPGLTAGVYASDLNFWTNGAATTNAALSGARLIVSMSYFAN